MTTADADAAVNDHWARDPFAPIDEPPHDPLTEAEREAALAAAQAWAAAQQAAAAAGAPSPPPEPPPEEGGARAMGAEPGGGYKTRSKR